MISKITKAISEMTAVMRAIVKSNVHGLPPALPRPAMRH